MENIYSSKKFDGKTILIGDYDGYGERYNYIKCKMRDINPGDTFCTRKPVGNDYSCFDHVDGDDWMYLVDDTVVDNKVWCSTYLGEWEYLNLKTVVWKKVDSTEL